MRLCHPDTPGMANNADPAGRDPSATQKSPKSTRDDFELDEVRMYGRSVPSHGHIFPQHHFDSYFSGAYLLDITKSEGPPGGNIL